MAPFGLPVILYRHHHHHHHYHLPVGPFSDGLIAQL